MVITVYLIRLALEGWNRLRVSQAMLTERGLRHVLLARRNHAAANHTVSAVRVRWKIVPVVAEVLVSRAGHHQLRSARRQAVPIARSVGTLTPSASATTRGSPGTPRHQGTTLAPPLRYGGSPGPPWSVDVETRPAIPL